MPPLKDRQSDIPILVNHFQEKLSNRMGQKKKEFSDDSMDILISYHWPGNVRELENMMERLAVLVDGNMIVLDDLPATLRNNQLGEKKSVSDFVNSKMGFNDAVELYQRSLILYALDKTDWVKAKAAELLKINRTTLVEKIKKMKISKPKKEESCFEIIDYPS
jgi:DNA-binding NtrC family response regulator